MPKSESKTANEQRAARTLRLYDGKQKAVVAMWADKTQMIGLCDLAYAARTVKAVTARIESTDIKTEKVVANVFKQTADIQVKADINGVNWKYEKMIQLIVEYQKTTGKRVVFNTIYKSERIGKWAAWQKESFRKNKLNTKQIDLCLSVGLMLEKHKADNMNTEQVYELLKHCYENDIDVKYKMKSIDFNGKRVNPKHFLVTLRSNWARLTEEQKHKFIQIGVYEKSDKKDRIWFEKFAEWKAVAQKGKVEITYEKQYNWQLRQRQKYKGTREYGLSELRMNALNAVNFKWVG